MKLSALCLVLLVSTIAACSPKGACLVGSGHDSCTEDEKKSACDQGSSNEFHEGTTCATLGFTVKGGKTWTKPDK